MVSPIPKLSIYRPFLGQRGCSASFTKIIHLKSSGYRWDTLCASRTPIKHGKCHFDGSNYQRTSKIHWIFAPTWRSSKKQVVPFINLWVGCVFTCMEFPGFREDWCCDGFPWSTRCPFGHPQQCCCWHDRCAGLLEKLRKLIALQRFPCLNIIELIGLVWFSYNWATSAKAQNKKGHWNRNQGLAESHNLLLCLHWQERDPGKFSNYWL